MYIHTGIRIAALANRKTAPTADAVITITERLTIGLVHITDHDANSGSGGGGSDGNDDHNKDDDHDDGEFLLYEKIFSRIPRIENVSMRVHLCTGISIQMCVGCETELMQFTTTYG